MTECTVNVMEAAKMLPSSRSHVYKLLDAGELRGYYTGNRRGFRVIERSVEPFVERRKEEAGVGLQGNVRVDI